MCTLSNSHHLQCHTPTCIQALYSISATNPLYAQMIEERWESDTVVLITPMAVEAEGKGQGLVCNFTSGADWWWECPSWSQRSNLPPLAAVYPPTDCKHNGSLWYWADCCFIRARTGVSGEELCLSLFDELVYFCCAWEAQNKLIGEQHVYQKLRNHSRWYWTVSATPEPPQKA